MQPYLSYTVHYISKDWKLKSNCLQTLFMPADHNGENLAESLRSVLESWSLQESKQVCLTTDNGTSITFVELVTYSMFRAQLTPGYN